MYYTRQLRLGKGYSTGIHTIVISMNGALKCIRCEYD